MKQGIIYKIAFLFRNILQVLSSIICGWISAWWFLASVAFLTDRPDRAEEAADIKISGWVMLLSGIIIIVKGNYNVQDKHGLEEIHIV